MDVTMSWSDLKIFAEIIQFVNDKNCLSRRNPFLNLFNPPRKEENNEGKLCRK
jgi:hypothetical protein